MTTKYRITKETQFTYFMYQPQIKVFGLWWNCGDARTSLNRAIASIKAYQYQIYYPTQEEIDNCKEEL